MSSGFMQSDGGMRSGVMIVAEALGANEAKQHKALVGASGFLMARAFSRKKWDRDEFRYANTLYCQPFKNRIKDSRGRFLPWIEDAIDHCAPNLDAEIDRSKPKVIVALGEVALERLTGMNKENTHFRREFMKREHGYAFREKQNRCWVVPTFHPAWIMRGNNAQTQVFMWDIDKARRMAREGYTHETPDCLLDPQMAAWEAYVERCVRFLCDTRIPRSERILAIDIENPTKRQFAEDESEIELQDADGIDVTFNIDRISFAFEVGVGASVPWAMPWLVGIHRILRVAAQNGLIVIWNRAHDRPRVMKATGIDLPVEWCEDAMNAWHVLYSSLDTGLGYATSCLPSSWRLPMWKHLSGTEEARYSAFDSIALLRNYKDTMRLLRSTGQMQVYREAVTDIDPALFYMGNAGMLTDPVKRATLQGELEVSIAELKGKMQSIVPDEVKGMKVWKTKKAADGSPVLVELQAEGAGELFEVAGMKEETT